MADKAYLVPRIDVPEYIETLLGICKKSRFSWLPPLLTRKLRSSPSIREFAAIGVELLVSYEETAHLCFDKFEM